MKRLKDISFGDVDAKNEILKQTRLSTKYFFDSYYIPKRIDINDIFLGAKYFIIGLKGTGKTALLRYIHNECLRKKFISEIILFKSHITEDDRQTLSKSSGYNIISTEKGHVFSQDFKEAWKWLIYQRVSLLIKRSGEKSPAVQKFLKLTGVEKNMILTSIGALFSAIKSGSIKISTEAAGVALEMGVELQASAKESSAPISDLNRACLSLLNDISLSKPIYLFFDELELFHETEDQFNRDRRILRDLVYAISHINADSSEVGRDMYICSTLRSEVLHSILELGQEIGRDIDDYGIRLDWSEGKDSVDHPLMQMIRRKISVSMSIDESIVWESIFPEKINNQVFYRFILNSSYYRPRDIVRLLRVARDFRDTDEKFTTEHFDKTSTEYSKQTWLEVTEELLAIYSTTEISGFQRLFLGFNTHFFKRDIHRRISEKYLGDKVVLETFRKHEMTKILSDLYRIGVIGNDFVAEVMHGQRKVRHRWIFRGNTTLNDAERMTFHKSLWKHLSLIERRK